MEQLIIRYRKSSNVFTFQGRFLEGGVYKREAFISKLKNLSSCWTCSTGTVKPSLSFSELRSENFIRVTGKQRRLKEGSVYFIFLTIWGPLLEGGV